SGGAGVQRWLKFVKYLRDFGWEPIVYTPSNPEFPENDTSLLKDVPTGLTIIQRPIWEPYGFYKRFVGKGSKEKIAAAFLAEEKRNPLTEKISVWIRGNLFFPDARRFWIRPSIKFLLQYLRKNPVDIIISTGPPHSMHMIAKGIVEKTGLPWIADFRDPWTNIDFYKDLHLTKWGDRKHRNMEQSVIRNANSVITISKSMAEEFSTLFNRKYEVITNGFDSEDVLDNKEINIDQQFSIAHIGSLVSSRNPILLWSVLKEIISEDDHFKNDLKITLAGRIDFSVILSLTEAGLDGYVEKIEYLPHNEVVKVQQKSQVLLLLINNTPNSKSILTGKFFEYLSAQRPILCIGPTDGDAAAILYDTKAGLISGFKDRTSLKKNILEYYRQFKEGNLAINSQNIEQFSRKALTGKLAELMEEGIKMKNV
ncbi:MAG: glycosyltransferase, partial [Bacteroidota bacterium]